MQQQDGTFRPLSPEEGKMCLEEPEKARASGLHPERVLWVGQEVTIQDCRFVVREIHKRKIVLEGIANPHPAEIPKMTLEEATRPRR